jgi:hypothetical protein
MRFDTTTQGGLAALLELLGRQDAGVADERRAVDFAEELRRLSGPSKAGYIPIALQVRRSRDARSQEGSLRDQVRVALERIAREADRRVVRVYAFEAISGALLGSKGALDVVLEDARASTFRELWVRDTSRLGRMSPREKSAYRFALEKAGVTVRYVTTDMDGAGSAGPVLEVIHDMKDNEELREKAVRTVERNYARHMERGVRAGPIPYGWAIEILNARGEVTRRVARTEGYRRSVSDSWRYTAGDPREVKAVRKIFSLFMEGKLGKRKIAEWLNEQEIPGPRVKTWSVSMVGKLITNPVHAGGLCFFRRTMGMFKTLREGRVVDVERPGQRTMREKPRSEWIVRWANHEPIVSREEWERVQDELGSRNRERANHRTLRPLDRIAPRSVVCDHCGYHLSTCRGYRRTRLRCTGYVLRGRSVCGPHSVADHELSGFLWRVVGNEVRALLGTTDLGRRVRERVRALLEEQQKEEVGRDPAPLRARIAGIDARVSLILGGLSAENLRLADGELTRLGQEKRELELRLQEAGLKARTEDLDASVKAAMKRLALLSKPVESVPVEEARELMTAILPRVGCRFSVRKAPGNRHKARLERVTLELLDPREFLTSAIRTNTSRAWP